MQDETGAGLVERKLPVFAKPKTPKGRYYVADNFLAAWLAALSSPVSALSFSPIEELVADANSRLMIVEGAAFEKLVAQLYEERSRKQLGDFHLSSHITGYWNSADTEIDLVALDEAAKRIRFGNCKRSPAKLLQDIATFSGHVARFLDCFPMYKSWTVEKVGLAPELGDAERAQLKAGGVIAQDLADLTKGML
jgi:hypothetical protein